MGSVGWFLKCLLFLWKAYQTFWQKNLSKRPPLATTVPFGTNTIIGALIYRDIFGSAIHARVMPPPFWGAAPR